MSLDICGKRSKPNQNIEVGRRFSVLKGKSYIHTWDGVYVLRIMKDMSWGFAVFLPGCTWRSKWKLSRQNIIAAVEHWQKWFPHRTFTKKWFMFQCYTLYVSLERIEFMDKDKYTENIQHFAVALCVCVCLCLYRAEFSLTCNLVIKVV